MLRLALALRRVSTTAPRLALPKGATGAAASPSSDPSKTEYRVQPLPRPNEPIDKKRARLVYQLRKRGILETDLLLSRFAAKYLQAMTYDELVEYDQLLDEQDWDIYYWATRNYDVKPIPERWAKLALMQLLQEMSENKERVMMRMPELSEMMEQHK